MTPADAATVGRIEELASSALSGAAVVLAPLGVGRHIDHLIVRDVAVALAHRETIRVGFWEDLPYAGRVPLDDLQREIETMMTSTGMTLRPCLVADADLAERKIDALACYPSQVVAVHRQGVLGHMQRVGVNGVPAERVWLAAA